jgi:membrane protease YdiL (CAAX protease family)
MNLLKRFPLTSFWILSFAWSWTCWGTLLQGGVPEWGLVWKAIYVAGLSGPSLAGILMVLASSGWVGLRQLTRRAFQWRGTWPWYVVALLLPVLLQVVPALLGSFVGAGDFSQGQVISLAATFQLFVLMLLFGGPLNEEIGWRGFALPVLLKRFSPAVASLVLGGFWALWHLPFWRMPLMPHQSWPFLSYLVLVLGLSILFTWLHRRTQGSLLTALLFHASINSALAVVKIYPPHTPNMRWFATWVGLVWLTAAVLIIRKRKEWLLRPEPSGPLVQSPSLAATVQ